jgi:hypothetical protein
MWAETQTVRLQLVGGGTRQGQQLGGMGGQLSTSTAQEQTISIRVTENKL